MPACVPIPPPGLTGFPEGPDHIRQLQLRWVDLAATELILRGQRIIDRTSAYHVCQGQQIPAYLDPQRDHQNVWTWVLGTSCPRFHEDLNQLAQLEAVALSDGVDEMFTHALASALIHPKSAPSTPTDAPTPGELFRLITASPEVRLLALVTAYLRAIEDGLLTS